MSNRAGHLKTNLAGETAYQSFVPAPLPPTPPLEVSGYMLDLLIKANAQLAVLDRAAAHAPDGEAIVALLVRREALLSSQIEGSRAALEDVFDPLAAQPLQAGAGCGAADAAGLARASEFAVKRLQELPLCSRLLQEAHAVLMEGACGQGKSPGRFRSSQNWIGAQGSTLHNAAYVPPSPDDMMEALSCLEQYIHADDNLDALIRAALIHYQFETIHPFLDGNGRIGRLLVTLFLMEQQILSMPALALSSFLKENRAEYYERMTEVRRKGDYEQWVKFFLEALLVSAREAVQIIDELAALHEQHAAVISKMGRAAGNVQLVFGFLKRCPVIDIGKTASLLGLSFNTVSSAVKRLIDAGILQQTGMACRNRTFAYEGCLAILRRGT